MKKKKDFKTHTAKDYNEQQEEVVDESMIDGKEHDYTAEEQAEVHVLLDMFSRAYTKRETASIVFNDMSYSQAYAYNQKKAINWSPKMKKGDKQVNAGLIHEKMISFSAIFLKYVFKNHITCYKDGKVVEGMGDIFELGIDYSRKMEKWAKKVGLIYWEMFSQGDCFVLEDWVVETKTEPKIIKAGVDGEDGVEVSQADIDYTYEYLDSLSYKDGKTYQTRKAESRILDGRKVILGDMDINELQDQPFLLIEDTYTHDQGEAMFGSLKRWNLVPKDIDELQNEVTQSDGKSHSLFTGERIDPLGKFVVHRYFNKQKNRFNLIINGKVMLPIDTPMTVLYPRGNYPVSQVSAERVRGSAYSRSIPAKTKFNADFLDWSLKALSEKFEQGLYPAILAKGKFTLASDMFKARKVTHGVKRDDYELANPEANGIAQGDYGFVQFIKEIVESQSMNGTTSGEFTGGATATEVAMVDQNQQEKLGYFLDGLVAGFMDMSQRRAETIESKYTLKEKETTVDGKKIAVYHDFTLNVAGVDHNVKFDDRLDSMEYTAEQKEADQYEMFEKAQNTKSHGSTPSEYYLVNPIDLRRKRYTLVIEVRPDKLKNSQLQMMQMWDEFTQAVNFFGAERINMDEIKKEYLEVSGRSTDFFLPEEVLELQAQERAQAQGQGGAYEMGQFGGGKPNISDAVKQQVTKRPN